MKFGRRGKRPPFNAVAFHHFRNLISQLFVNPPVRFVFEFRLGDGSAVLCSCSISNRETAGLVGNFVEESAVCVRGIKCLHQTKTGPAGRRLIYSIGFQASAVGDDNE